MNQNNPEIFSCFLLMSNLYCVGILSFPLPHVVKPRMTVKKILKIVFDSPKFYISTIFCKWSCMTKKINEFLIGNWIFSWFNIGPISLSKKKKFLWTGKLSSLWFCFDLWLACKSSRIQFQRRFFELHFWRFLLIVVQIRDKTCLNHEKCWAKSENCRGSWTWIWYQSIFTLQKHVATSINLWVAMYSRQATAWNCENSAVSFVMKYCPFSTTLRNPACIHTKFTQLI